MLPTLSVQKKQTLFEVFMAHEYKKKEKGREQIHKRVTVIKYKNGFIKKDILGFKYLFIEFSAGNKTYRDT